MKGLKTLLVKHAEPESGMIKGSERINKVLEFDLDGKKDSNLESILDSNFKEEIRERINSNRVRLHLHTKPNLSKVRKNTIRRPA